MRGKRSKQYKKLMNQFSLSWGFREPYQVIVDADMVKDSVRFKYDLVKGLERTLHGTVKPMITQCSMRQLYAQKTEPNINEVIDLAKTIERRRCGHHPDQYAEPLGTPECLKAVFDPKDSGTNKHRYVLAAQDHDVRKQFREIEGVPIIYIKRSVMIMEPMATESLQVRAREEKSKFRAEIKKFGGKRKRAESDDGAEEGGETEKQSGARNDAATEKKKSKKGYGPKGPNPLSVKKPKKKIAEDSVKDSEAVVPTEANDADAPLKKRRQRKPKTSAGDDATGQEAVSGEVAADA